MLLRAATPEDALGVARVHVRAWQTGYRELLPHEYLANLHPEERAQRYDFANDDPRRPKTIVAIDDDAVRGFATIAPAHDSDTTDDGELCALYVDPDRWGQGIGIALISAARNRLIELDYHYARLWLLVGNARAARFYRADGWAPDGIVRTETIWGVSVDELRYRRSL
ncbi:GNAT family N-acetyltransferase [Dyella sp. 2HG41-7]|uniref:GNAT family N-acetyltransferase n=1 Tax=Dyella sp. 2HG41-7 TaxID=2883239 RepID=UPI001F38E2AE|nr:GNAT family N-acetyltransferase [Dyella sp. 2HG41-7]